MTRYIVIVDDERTFKNIPESHVRTTGVVEVVYLRTSQEAMAWFATFYSRYIFASARDEILAVYFDHDLGGSSEGTGEDVAKFVALLVHARFGHPPAFWGCSFYIHSMNPVGAKNIAAVFRSIGTGVAPLIIPLPELDTEETTNA